MVVLRLARSGSKKRPFYRIVAADKRSPRDGKVMAYLGFFNPIAAGPEEKLRIDRTEVTKFIDQGAQMTDRVRDLLKEWDSASKAS